MSFPTAPLPAFNAFHPTRQPAKPEHPHAPAVATAWLHSHLQQADFQQPGRPAPPSQDGAGTRDPDLIHPGEQIHLGPHAPWPDTQPVKPVYSVEEIKRQMWADIHAAQDIATQDAFVNDPARTIAQSDPVAYAQAKAIAAHADDPIYRADDGYQRALKDAARDVRLQFVKEQVDQKMHQPEPDIRGALKVAQTAMLADPAHRQQIYDETLAPYFTKAFFEARFQRLQDTPVNPSFGLENDPILQGDKIADDWLKTFGQDAPAEVCQVALGVVKERMGVLLSAHNDAGIVFNSGAKFYRALSAMVQGADSNGAHNAQEVARLLVDLEPDAAFLAQLGSPLGASIQDKGMALAVGEGDAALSVALVNELKARLQDDDGLRGQFLLQMAEGVSQLREGILHAIDNNVAKNGDALFVASFLGGDTAQALQSIAQARAADPGAANENDRQVLDIGLRGQHLGAVVTDLARLEGVDPEHLGKGEAQLFDELKQTDDEPRIVAAMAQSRQLQQAALAGLQIDLSDAGLESTFRQIGFVGLSNEASIARYAGKMMKAVIGHRFTNVSDRIFIGAANPYDVASFNAIKEKVMTKLGIPPQTQAEMRQVLLQLQKDIAAAGDDPAAVKRLAEAAQQRYLALAEGQVPGAGAVVKDATPYNARLGGAQSLRVLAAGAYAVATWIAIQEATRGEGASVLNYAEAGIYGTASAVSASELVAGLMGRSLNDLRIGSTAVWSIGSKVLGWVTLIPTAIGGAEEFASGDWEQGTMSAGILAGGITMLVASGPAVPIAAVAILLLAGGKLAFSLYERVKASNQYEYNDNEVVRKALQPFFRDDQLRQLLNSTQNGESPMVAWRQLANFKKIPPQDVLPYLQGLDAGQISALVRATHPLQDDAFDAGQPQLPADKLRALDEKMKALGIEMKAQPQAAPVPAPAPGPEDLYPPQIYVVHPGDDLQTIAQLHGVPIEQLYRRNPVFDPALADGDFFSRAG